MAMAGNCPAYQNLPKAVRAEYLRICAVLPGLLNALLLLRRVERPRRRAKSRLRPFLNGSGNSARRKVG